MRDRQRGQVLVFFALTLPLVLLPIAAYAVDAAVTASDYSRLVEVTVRAAEAGAQQIDVTRLRAAGAVEIDLAQATLAAGDVIASSGLPARIVALAVLGSDLRLATTETVVLPFDFAGASSNAVRASVTARIAPGYDSPSSLLPFPLSSF